MLICGHKVTLNFQERRQIDIGDGAVLDYFCVVELLKRILFSLFAVFVLAGTAGFYVFEHSCKVDGTDSHLYIKAQHACDDVAVESCCHEKEVPNPEKDCCDDEVKVFQTEYDYFHDGDAFSFVAVAKCCHVIPCFAFEIEETPELTSTGNHGPPLVRSGRFISVANQVFRC